MHVRECFRVAILGVIPLSLQIGIRCYACSQRLQGLDHDGLLLPGQRPQGHLFALVHIYSSGWGVSSLFRCNLRDLGGCFNCCGSVLDVVGDVSMIPMMMPEILEDVYRCVKGVRV